MTAARTLTDADVEAIAEKLRELVERALVAAGVARDLGRER